MLEVFFEATTAVQFSTSATQSWADYFANVGGLLGLCIGLSIVTLVELAWLGMKLTWKVKDILMQKKGEKAATATEKFAWKE